MAFIFRMGLRWTSHAFTQNGARAHPHHPRGNVLHLGGRTPGMNRLAHLLTGNINAWTGVAAVLAAPVLLSAQRGSVGVVEETLAAVAPELVQEVGAAIMQSASCW